MTQPYSQSAVPSAIRGLLTAESLTSALATPLRAALAQYPELTSDPGGLADRLAPTLAARLADTFSQALRPGARSAPAAAPDSPATGLATDPVEVRVLRAIIRHPAGREPGLAPDALATLTGLSPAALGPIVSTLVQAGELIRDTWLVRLPAADDLLPQPLGVDDTPRRDEGVEDRVSVDRRAIGDRRAVGERRLYERRNG